MLGDRVHSDEGIKGLFESTKFSGLSNPPKNHKSPQFAKSLNGTVHRVTETASGIQDSGGAYRFKGFNIEILTLNPRPRLRNNP